MDTTECSPTSWTPRRKRKRLYFIYSDYTIGWIYALPETELVAAMAMLDEIHPVLPVTNPQDANTYVLGRIHDHNVVIACLPEGEIGKVSAATVAKDMTRSFPAVRFGLMVGIGGGAPYYGAQGNESEVKEENSKDDTEDIRDIRLGNVIISLYSKLSDAVVQYDFRKLLQEKEFVLSSGKLNKPSNIVLGTVGTLRAHHKLYRHKICETLSELLIFTHSEGHKSCQNCCGLIDSNLVKRKDCSDNLSRLHYGIIGSADRAREENIICFEMEAAGLMDSFPCLIIRGICDYADSYKNKIWQLYSVATAVLYARELLLVVSGQGVVNMD
ncbi:nucleoside phosphorylase domain-containing protein [Aspergillus caelatus]|uniref:Nucleoside phosphorylase domain-containing protein n=1 Tax=Aspergillus caelatus TaxID=61420 RepID=A0A5N6ZMZ4_9EURO|nr:nucleoside phosphorylase domain-containing protein [Aspergillus caelatus]KAE8358209.1 nucleoside phosphorylase domain-containing protein [Aspergillus caelatus]